MNAWAVTASCGDYYCGCGVSHLLGVYTDEEKANGAAETARIQRCVWTDAKGGNHDDTRYWSEVEVVSGELDRPIDPVVHVFPAPEWGRPPLSSRRLGATA